MQTLLCHKTNVILATSSRALQYRIIASLSFLEAELSICISAGVLREHIQEFCPAPSHGNPPNKGSNVPFLCHSLTRPHQLFATPHATRANQPDD